jgi:nitrogen fixation NifU-like protein
LSLTDDLYRDIILEHFKNPRNHGHLDQPDLTAQGVNPFCGDELEITLALQGETIREIRSQSKGCSISQASASMMTEAVKGKTLAQAEQLAKQFKGLMLENTLVDFPPDLEDLESLEGVKKYPVRIKCAILSWNTLLEGIHAHRSGGSQATHVEGEEGERPELAQQVEGSSTIPSPLEGEGKGEGDPQEEVRTALRQVIDPELNMNVIDLGLIYGTDIDGGQVKVTYTLTSPGCPLGPVIKGQIQSALTRLNWVKQVQTDLVWNPPWDPRTMASEECKMELGIW